AKVPLQFLTRLAAIAGARADDDTLAQTLDVLSPGKTGPSPRQVAVLRGLGQGLQNSRRSLAQLWENPPAKLQPAIAKTQPFFEQAARTARDDKAALPNRIAAVELLGYG